jgi:hypothetical protein
MDLLEIPAFRSNPRFSEIGVTVAEDFEEERVSLAHETPQLRAEALTFEARYQAVPKPPTEEANYGRAVELISEAIAVDRPARGDDPAFRLRISGYEQRLATWSALNALQAASRDMEKRLVDRQDKALDAARSESIQLLGLLAGVVGLITSLFAAAKSDPRELLVAALSSSMAIIGFLVVFSVLVGRLTDKARIAQAVLTFLVLLGVAVVIWRV